MPLRALTITSLVFSRRSCVFFTRAEQLQQSESALKHNVLEREKREPRTLSVRLTDGFVLGLTTKSIRSWNAAFSNKYRYLNPCVPCALSYSNLKPAHTNRSDGFTCLVFDAFYCGFNLRTASFLSSVMRKHVPILTFYYYSLF